MQLCNAHHCLAKCACTLGLFPLATNNLPERTDGGRSIPSVFSRDSSLLPSSYADGRLTLKRMVAMLVILSCIAMVPTMDARVPGAITRLWLRTRTIPLHSYATYCELI